MTHRHRWHGYEKFADVPDVEPDPDDTQAIAKYAVKLLLRALLDDGVMQRTMMLFAVSVSRLLPDFSFAVATNRVVPVGIGALSSSSAISSVTGFLCCAVLNSGSLERAQ